MPNPVLNEKTLGKAYADDPAGWAAPTTAPIDDGPISPYRSDRLTVGGVSRAGLILFAILLAGAAFGWRSVPTGEGVRFPGWLILAAIGGFVTAIFTSFKPKFARFSAPVYAALEGVFLGGISKVYESQYNGIVTQALLGTVGVFIVMLVLYQTRILRVTPKMQKMVMAATVGVGLIYLVGFVARMFGDGLGFINSPSALGIGFSVLVVGIAAFNLALDFDLIEKLERTGAPRWMEWYAAFGLMVTVVWLYLEILRLLSKLNRR